MRTTFQTRIDLNLIASHQPEDKELEQCTKNKTRGTRNQEHGTKNKESNRTVNTLARALTRRQMHGDDGDDGDDHADARAAQTYVFKDLPFFYSQHPLEY